MDKEKKGFNNLTFIIKAERRRNMYLISFDSWLIRTRDEKEKVITVKCPGCSNWSYLNHEINPNGEVSPSLVCDWDRKEMGGKCPFHEFIKLENWDGGEFSHTTNP